MNENAIRKIIQDELAKFRRAHLGFRTYRISDTPIDKISLTTKGTINNQFVATNANSTFNNGVNLSFGTSTGSQIGTGASQKIGFYGATPVVQQAAIGSPTGGATIDTQARAAINSIISELHNLGLTA